MQVISYKDLTVWQKSMDLVEMVYTLTKNLPSEEKFGLVTQMQRAAVSIPSNIAEGKMRGTKKDYVRFLRMSYGSGAELETQFELIKRLYTVDTGTFLKATELLNEVMRMLNVMIRKRAS